MYENSVICALWLLLLKFKLTWYPQTQKKNKIRMSTAGYWINVSSQKYVFNALYTGLNADKIIHNDFYIVILKIMNAIIILFCLHYSWFFPIYGILEVEPIFNKWISINRLVRSVHVAITILFIASAMQKLSEQVFSLWFYVGIKSIISNINGLGIPLEKIVPEWKHRALFLSGTILNKYIRYFNNTNCLLKWKWNEADTSFWCAYLLTLITIKYL